MTANRKRGRFTLNRRTFAGASAGAAVLATAPWMRVGAQEAEEELEVFSWWTNPGEVDGLQALFDHFAEGSPDVEITNATAAGGAGVTRRSPSEPPQRWDPPDSGRPLARA